jgi:hypothetical protein
MQTAQAHDPATTTRTIMAAMRDRDFETFGAALAPDVVLHSPITSSFRFEGRDEVLELVQIVRNALEDFRPGESFGDQETQALMFEARIGRQALNGLDVLRFDAEGRVREFRVFIRPLSGLTALMAALAPRIAARRSRLVAAAIRPPTRLQLLLARTGDRISVPVLRGAFRRGG